MFSAGVPSQRSLHHLQNIKGFYNRSGATGPGSSHHTKALSSGVDAMCDSCCLMVHSCRWYCMQQCSAHVTRKLHLQGHRSMWSYLGEILNHLLKALATMLFIAQHRVILSKETACPSAYVQLGTTSCIRGPYADAAHDA